MSKKILIFCVFICFFGFFVQCALIETQGINEPLPTISVPQLDLTTTHYVANKIKLFCKKICLSNPSMGGNLCQCDPPNMFL